MSAHRELGWLFAGALVLAGCQQILGFEEFDRSGGAPAEAGAGGDGTGGTEQAGTGGTEQAGTGGTGQGGTGGAAGSASCPTLPPFKDNREMVPVTRKDGSCFWVDRREVSRAEYAAFLDATEKAKPKVVPEGPPACATDTTLEPNRACFSAAFLKIQVDSGADKENGPVTCVDWCDAATYCMWAGKHLCKGEAGAPKDPAKSAWYAACSDDDAHPYGNGKSDYVENACRDNGKVDCKLTSTACSMGAVGAQPACATLAGALDMSGNAAEWTLECAPGDSLDATCSVRGGSAESVPAATRCDTLDEIPRKERNEYIGFRCCYQQDG